MSRRAALLGLLIALVLFATPAAAQTPASSALVDQAGQAYDQSRYGDAAQLYRRAAESGGEGPELRYDLGNCYLKAGDLGRAILEYRRALASEPSLVAAQKNLALARSLLPARVAPYQPSPWEAAIARIPVRGLQWLVIVLALVANAGLALVILLASGRGRRAAAVLLVGAAVCAGLACTALLYAKTVLPSHRPAVVLRSAPVHAAPEAQGAPLATLPAGSEVILAARAGDRVLVLWGEGRGWTEASAVEAP